MANFDRFGKRWALTGATLNPSDIFSESGFAALGDNPPSIELFNALFQRLDDKDNWLYLRITEVLSAAGITASDATQNQLLTALRNIFAPGGVAITTSQSFITPAGVTKLKIKLWGGGGGGGGAIGINSAASGGGGGGYTEGIFTVVPNSSVFVSIGAGGFGAGASAIFSAGAGGTTSFGSMCSATGGAPGVAGNGGAAVSAGAGGNGLGGFLNLSGVGGGLGQFYGGGSLAAGVFAAGGGLGGGSPFGGGMSPLSIGAAGNPGVFPGGGGTGAGSVGSTAFGGGPGAGGLAIIEW